MSVGVVEPAMYSAAFFNIILIICCYVTIIVLELDYSFIAWSYAFSSAMRTVIEISLSLRYPEVIKTLTYPTYEIFNEWKEFFELGIPGCVMICAEW
jgi:hypothetical protein